MAEDQLHSDRQETQYQLRLPDELHAALTSSAQANSRTLKSEINARLMASFELQSSLSPAISKLIEDHIQSEVQARLRAIASSIGASA